MAENPLMAAAPVQLVITYICDEGVSQLTWLTTEDPAHGSFEVGVGWLAKDFENSVL